MPRDDLHQRFLEDGILVTEQPWPPSVKPAKQEGAELFDPADTQMLRVLDWQVGNNITARHQWGQSRGWTVYKTAYLFPFDELISNR